MREFTHPPGPGARREVASLGRLEANQELQRAVREFALRAETIKACGLIAEVSVENGYLTLYATRRTQKVRRG
jgi:hypothetical protein